MTPQSKLIAILYSTPMVQAKLAGLKTQTRRIAGLQEINLIAENVTGPEYEINPMTQEGMFGELKQQKGFHAIFSHGAQPYAIKCPYGQPGDILWTRETWANLNHDFKNVPLYFIYKADLEHENQHGPITWKPGIHMPFAACRSFDVVTAIRAERIMDISREDAIAEGIERWTEDRLKSKPTRYKLYSIDEDESQDLPFYTSCPIDSYRSLWQHLNGTPKPIQKKIDGKLVTTGYIAYPWGDEQSLELYKGLTTWRGKPLTVVPNPWVWVVEFRPCTDDEFGLIKYA